MERLQHLLYKAWRFWKDGIPIPLDLHADLMSLGFKPSEIEEAFEDGQKPEEIAWEVSNRVVLRLFGVQFREKDKDEDEEDEE